MLTLDANVRVYAADTRDPLKHRAAIEIIALAVNARSKLGLQAIGEFFVVCTRKLRFPPTMIDRRVQDLLATFETFSYTRTGLAQAAALAAGRYFFWDAVLIASAEEAGCTVMLSEDMGDGARFGNLMVINPFGPDGMSQRAKEALAL
ncbi:MAG: PIN domain-containing protein [Alphaproteobacteria bacterium]|nr:PIN domain-containing protein [Alphaproteobacteria bacterium]